MKLLLIILKVISIISGIVILLISAVSIIDPAGAQLSNDSDPFGGPTIIGAYFLLLFSIILIFWPIVLYFFKRNYAGGKPNARRN